MMYRTTQRLCFTRDRRRVVPEGHTEAHTLFAPAGRWLPDAVAARYDLAGVERMDMEHAQSTRDNKALDHAPRTEHVPGPPETQVMGGPEETQVIPGPPEAAVIRRANRKEKEKGRS